MVISRHVQSFITVVQYGSFKKAAEESFISTPAIIQQMNLLERELGVKLLERTHRGVAPTKAGEVFYERMCAILEEVNEATRLTVQAAGTPASHITIAYAQNLQYAHIYGIYQRYVQESGGIMNLVPLPYDEALRGAVEGRYDGCFLQLGERVRQSGLRAVPFLILKPTLAVPRDHPLAAKARLEIADLERAEVVLPEYGLYDSCDAFYDEIRSSGVSARIVNLTSLLESELYCREHGAVRLCAHRVIDPDMVMVPIETRARFTVCLACRPGDPGAGAMSTLLRLARVYCRSAAEQAP